MCTSGMINSRAFSGRVRAQGPGDEDVRVCEAWGPQSSLIRCKLNETISFFFYSYGSGCLHGMSLLVELMLKAALSCR